MNPADDITPDLMAEIDAYYSGALSEEKAAALRQRINEDEGLAAAVAAHEALIRNIIRPAKLTPARAEALRERFREFDERSSGEKEAPLPPPAAKRRTLTNWWPAAAAAAVVLLVAAIWVFSRPGEGERLAAENFTWLPREEARLNGAQDGETGLRAYDRKSYDEAYPLIFSGIRSGGLDSLNLLYAGIAALGAAEPTIARTAFTDLIETGRYPYQSAQARYYLALAELSLENKAGAIEALGGIPTDYPDIREKAAALRRQLDRLE